MAGKGQLARQVRTGLEEEELTASVSNSDSRPDPLEEISFGKTVRQHVREFGALFGVVCFIIAGVKGYRGNLGSGLWTFAALGLVFPALGYFAPRLLHPVWKGWMKFAHVLSIVMTFVLLSLVWILGFIPMSAIVKIFRVKVMDLSFRSGADTYWETRKPEQDDFQRLVRQY